MPPIPMPGKPRTTRVAARLRDLMDHEDFRLTREALARRMGVSTFYLGKLLGSRARVTANTAVRLERAFDGRYRAEEWMDLQRDDSLEKERAKHERASAGQ